MKQEVRTVANRHDRHAEHHAHDAAPVPSDVELYDTKALMALIAGSTRRWWLVKAAELVRAGVLKKDGKRWIGSRSAILRALTEGA
jgi:hypothetical protein